MVNLGRSSHLQYRDKGRGDGEDIDRIGVTPGLNLHLLWLRGYDARSNLKVKTNLH